MRVLIDSSTLIALAKIGELDILRDIFKTIHITSQILCEILNADYPEMDAFEKATDEWIHVLDCEGDTESLKKYGLDMGEASLFLVAEPHDMLVIDEANGRRFAESNNHKFTGLLGLLVASVRTGKIRKKKALEVLSKLTKGDFRISSDLYVWAIEEIGLGDVIKG